MKNRTIWMVIVILTMTAHSAYSEQKVAKPKKVIKENLNNEQVERLNEIIGELKFVKNRLVKKTMTIEDFAADRSNANTWKNNIALLKELIFDSIVPTGPDKHKIGLALSFIEDKEKLIFAAKYDRKKITDALYDIKRTKIELSDGMGTLQKAFEKVLAYQTLLCKKILLVMKGK